MMFLTIAIIATILASTADGAGTDFAIKRGHVEADRIMVRIFGTDRPSARTIFLRGGLVIAGESGFAWIFSRFHPHSAAFFATAFFIQTAIHGFEAYRGFTSKAAN